MSEQKVVIVTGAGSGIGAATAKRFGQDGFNVVLTGRTESKLKKVADEIGDNAMIIPSDVSLPDDAEMIIAKTIETFGRIDALINNAAIFIGGTIDAISLDDWNKQLAINTTGPFLMIKSALPHLEETKGAVVNVSSVSGIGGDWGAFAYNTTKGALNLMTKGLALDLAPKGVRVNAVAPSLTQTEMVEFIMNNKEVLTAIENRIAMGRPGKPEEVADVIAFLAGEQARFVTGTIVPVDGGLSASNGQAKL